MNGYVEKGGQKFLWIAKRSETKSTYPGMLDNLVAGGLVCNNIWIYFRRLETDFACIMHIIGRLNIDVFFTCFHF